MEDSRPSTDEGCGRSSEFQLTRLAKVGLNVEERAIYFPNNAERSFSECYKVYQAEMLSISSLHMGDDAVLGPVSVYLHSNQVKGAPLAWPRPEWTCYSPIHRL